MLESKIESLTNSVDNLNVRMDKINTLVEQLLNKRTKTTSESKNPLQSQASKSIVSVSREMLIKLCQETVAIGSKRDEDVDYTSTHETDKNVCFKKANRRVKELLKEHGGQISIKEIDSEKLQACYDAVDNYREQIENGNWE